MGEAKIVPTEVNRACGMEQTIYTRELLPIQDASGQGSREVANQRRVMRTRSSIQSRYASEFNRLVLPCRLPSIPDSPKPTFTLCESPEKYFAQAWET